MFVCIPHAYLLPKEARSGCGCQIPWDWLVTVVVSHHARAGNPNLGLLEQQPTLFSVEPPFQSGTQGFVHAKQALCPELHLQPLFYFSEIGSHCVI